MLKLSLSENVLIDGGHDAFGVYQKAQNVAFGGGFDGGEKVIDVALKYGYEVGYLNGLREHR